MKRTVPLILVVMLAGCINTSRLEVNAWIVRRVPQAAPPNAADAILVEFTRIDVASYLNGVVVQRENGKLETYIRHQWADSVGEMVRVWTHSRLSESPRIRGVVGPGPGEGGNVRIRIEVRRFEFVETGNGASVATVELWGEIQADHTDPEGKIRVGREPFGPIVAMETAEVTAGEYLPVAMAVALGRAIETLVPIVEAAASAASQ